MSKISKREKEVLHLIAQGKNGMVIAEELGISHQTVRHHAMSIRKKLGLSREHNQVAFVTKAIEQGILTTNNVRHNPEVVCLVCGQKVKRGGLTRHMERNHPS